MLKSLDWTREWQTNNISLSALPALSLLHQSHLAVAIINQVSCIRSGVVKQCVLIPVDRIRAVFLHQLYDFLRINTFRVKAFITQYMMNRLDEIRQLEVIVFGVEIRRWRGIGSRVNVDGFLRRSHCWVVCGIWRWREEMRRKRWRWSQLYICTHQRKIRAPSYHTYPTLTTTASWPHTHTAYTPPLKLSNKGIYSYQNNANQQHLVKHNCRTTMWWNKSMLIYKGTKPIEAGQLYSWTIFSRIGYISPFFPPYTCYNRIYGYIHKKTSPKRTSFLLCSRQRIFQGETEKRAILGSCGSVTQHGGRGKWIKAFVWGAGSGQRRVYICEQLLLFYK